MLSGSFFFSEKPRDRIKRHLIFWLCWWLYFGMLHAINPFGKEEISYFRNLPFTIPESILHLIPQMLITYSILYFVWPRYILTRTYFKAGLLFVLIIFSGAILNLVMIKEVNPRILSFVLPERFLQNTGRPPSVSFFMAMMANFKGGLTAAAIATSFKFIKEWYLKEQKNIQLLKENADSQLRLLTAQVHPHFLFNTLNNIYSKTQTESPGGSMMIMELSDLLRYILYEGSKPLVSLDKELQMMQGYIHLEKIRYGNKLEVHVSMPENAHEFRIAPLLLLPFIENCFKHGTSNMLLNPWVNLVVEMKENMLVMKLMNGKVDIPENKQQQSGIGINNVMKRLGLLYQKRFELQITDEAGIFIVDLKVVLARKQKNELETPQITTEPSYA